MKKRENVEISGKVRITINGVAFSSVSAEKNKITVFINDPNYLKKIVKKAKLSIKSINHLGMASEYLNRMGIGLNVSDSKGTFIQLGRGAYSPLIKAKVSTKRLIEFFI